MPLPQGKVKKVMNISGIDTVFTKPTEKFEANCTVLYCSGVNINKRENKGQACKEFNMACPPPHEKRRQC